MRARKDGSRRFCCGVIAMNSWILLSFKVRAGKHAFNGWGGEGVLNLSPSLGRGVTKKALPGTDLINSLVK